MSASTTASEASPDVGRPRGVTLDSVVSLLCFFLFFKSKFGWFLFVGWLVCWFVGLLVYPFVCRLGGFGTTHHSSLFVMFCLLNRLENTGCLVGYSFRFLLCLKKKGAAADSCSVLVEIWTI